MSPALAMAELSEQFCIEFEKASNEGKNWAPKAALDLCMEVIWKHKHAYYFTGPCENFLTHPENRSRLMLSARNAHKLAEQIHLSGADFAELGNSLCFEIATDASKRKDQLDKNSALIKRAGRLLAEVNGAERFLAVGCGHTAAMCKLAQAGGRTSSKLLQDSSGYGCFETEEKRKIVSASRPPAEAACDSYVRKLGDVK